MNKNLLIENQILDFNIFLALSMLCYENIQCIKCSNEVYQKYKKSIKIAWGIQVKY